MSQEELKVRALGSCSEVSRGALQPQDGESGRSGSDPDLWPLLSTYPHSKGRGAGTRRPRSWGGRR